jgi:hypothetical protein
MALSKQSLEILLDLIEIKVSSLQTLDRDDTKEHNKLRRCRQELRLALAPRASKHTAQVSPEVAEHSLASLNRATELSD